MDSSRNTAVQTVISGSCDPRGSCDAEALYATHASRPPSRRVDVVIIGAGPSGLVAAYRLRDSDILLLEREAEVGGNARSDSWNGLVYPAGAIVTHAESPAMNLYAELGLHPRPLPDSDPPITFVGDRMIKGDLWDVGLDRLYGKDAARDIRRARHDLLTMDVEGERETLDETTLASLLRPYRLEVKEWFDRLLAWFAGTTDDFSAYIGAKLARSQMGQGLSILYPEGSSDGGRYSFPGGLGEAALALRRAIDASGRDRVWTDCRVLRVEQDDAGVSVAVRRSGSTTTVRARAAIVATSKLVARGIIADLPRAQRAAMGRMRYRSFLAAAIAVNGVVSRDVRVARTLDAPMANLRDVSTDPTRQIFRCELPIGGHAHTAPLAEASLGSLAGRIVAYMDRLFPGAREHIDQVRIWRWVHNWYLPVPGMVTRIQPAAARRIGRISFANADSLGPISEFGWAMRAADRAVAEVRAMLATGTSAMSAPGSAASATPPAATLDPAALDTPAHGKP